MKKYFYFPEGFDTIQFTKVMVKACDRAYDLMQYYKYENESYYQFYLRDDEALYFACELLDYYDVKAIYNTIRITKRLEHDFGKTYDEAEIYCKLMGIGYYR